MFAAPALVTVFSGAVCGSFVSPWSVGAGAFALVIVCLVIQQIRGVVGVLQVSLELITSDAYLDADPETVKLNLLLYGAQAQRQNNAYIDRMAPAVAHSVRRRSGGASRRGAVRMTPTSVRQACRS